MSRLVAGDGLVASAHSHLPVFIVAMNNLAGINPRGKAVIRGESVTEAGRCCSRFSLYGSCLPTVGERDRCRLEPAAAVRGIIGGLAKNAEDAIGANT
jgi:hypothetical protein